MGVRERGRWGWKRKRDDEESRIVHVQVAALSHRI